MSTAILKIQIPKDRQTTIKKLKCDECEMSDGGYKVCLQEGKQSETHRPSIYLGICTALTTVCTLTCIPNIASQ